MFFYYCSRRRMRVYGILLALLLLAVLCWCLWPARAVTTNAGEARLVPIYQVETPQQAVAISFDASWGAEHTKDILDTLDAYDVKATFFLVNIWLSDYPDEALDIALRGHEIGLHSETHPHFTELSVEQMVEELTGNAEMINSVTGYRATLFRPPFGDYDNRVIETASSLGYTTIQWSIDSLDWKDLSADEICQRVLKDIEAGDIVLFHNNGLHTAEALPIILSTLQEKGLEVIPISDLLLTGNTYVDANGVQKKQ